MFNILIKVGSIMIKKKVKIVYYSGTGGTAKAANYFQTVFKIKGFKVVCQQIKPSWQDKDHDYDMLVLLFAVHAFNAPKAVYTWISQLTKVNNLPAVIISVSGGGEIMPNTACRRSSIKRLEKKGYKVIYEKMLVMPSNILIATNEILSRMLLEILPNKIDAIVDDLEKGVIHRTKPYLIDKIISYLGEMEKPVTKYFGKKITSTNLCNGCGWCVKNCPANNINLVENRPIFNSKCHMCLNCIYGCPNKALVPNSGKFLILKNGYNLKSLENMGPIKENVDINKLAKGYAWSGVKKYLLEDENTKK